MNSEQFNHWLEEKNTPSITSVFKKPLIMGILNITKDSFSDGGRFLSQERACEQAFHLISHGADIIDIGGESTKPGADPVPLEVELNRVIPIIEQIRKHSDICISIDTYKPVVMAAAVDAGANMINDVYALQHEGALTVSAQLSVPICLMHMKGHPKTMQHNPVYLEGLIAETLQFFEERIQQCNEAGIRKNRLILDPGFGFGKQVHDNLHIMYHIDKFNQFNLPLLVGVSRKSLIGSVLHKEVSDRLIGGVALAVYFAMHGIGIVRTHDVDETMQALDMINAIYKNNRGSDQ